MSLLLLNYIISNAGWRAPDVIEMVDWPAHGRAGLCLSERNTSLFFNQNGSFWPPCGTGLVLIRVLTTGAQDAVDYMKHSPTFFNALNLQRPSYQLGYSLVQGPCLYC
jgi:hypothetical protein